MNTTPPRTMLHASFHRTSFRAIKRSRNARCSSLSITINERAFYHPSLVTRPSIFPSLRFCVSRPPLSNYRAATIFLGELSFLFIFFLHGVERMDHSPDRNCDLLSSIKKKGKRERGKFKKMSFFFYKRAFFINNNVGQNLWRERPAATDDYVDDASRVDAFEIHRVFPFESINGMRWTEGGDWLLVSLVMKNR